MGRLSSLRFAMKRGSLVLARTAFGEVASHLVHSVPPEWAAELGHHGLAGALLTDELAW
jgi:hypothetical protein